MAGSSTSKAVRSLPFARVTSLAAGVIAATGILDLVTGVANVSAAWTVLVTAVAAAIAVVPIVLGERFPPWVALVGCALFVGVTTLQTAQSADAIMAVNNLVLYPMVSCYLGWFFSHRMARLGVVAMFAVSACGVWVSGLASVFTTWANLALASLFCLEAALYLRAKLERIIETDPLTGALNRHGLASRLARDLAHQQRTGEPLAVAVIDCDGFKAINDRFGHAAGDRTLSTLVTELQTATRQRDSIARTGGDEFVLVLPNTSRGSAQGIVDRLQRDSTVAWSYGVVEACSSDTEEGLVARADGELYRSRAR